MCIFVIYQLYAVFGYNTLRRQASHADLYNMMMLKSATHIGRSLWKWVLPQSDDIPALPQLLRLSQPEFGTPMHSDTQRQVQF